MRWVILSSMMVSALVTTSPVWAQAGDLSTTPVDVSEPTTAQPTTAQPPAEQETQDVEQRPEAAGQDVSPNNAVEELIRILEDEQARQQLLEDLRASQSRQTPDPTSEGTEAMSAEADTANANAAENPTDPTTVPTETAADETLTEPTPRTLSLARQIVVQTESFTEQFVSVFRQVTDAVQSIVDLFTGQIAVNWNQVQSAIQSLGWIALITIGGFLITRRFAYGVFGFASKQAKDASLQKRFVWRISATALDAALVWLAWFGGYIFAISLSDQGSIPVRQSLFLNAFLVSGLVTVVLRVVFSANYPNLRLIPIETPVAKYWQFWLARLVDVMAYGMLLLAPIVALDIFFLAGRAVSTLVMVLGAALAITIILRGRGSVALALTAVARRLPNGLMGWSLRILATTWHLLAIFYVLIILVIWMTRPFGAIAHVIASTLETILAVAVAVALFKLLTLVLKRGVPLPNALSSSLPLLQARLDNLIPILLKVVRAFVVFMVIFIVLDVWEFIDLYGWMTSDVGSVFAGGIASAALVVLIALLIYLAVMSWIEYRLSPSAGRSPTPRERTLLALFQNAFTVTLFIITLLLALTELQINIAPFLAGAGVLGLAIGFGAQKLVQDIITGAFIQIENAMNEGDVVTVSGVSGTVERLTIRSVGLRDLDGVYHLIPFSSVDQIANYMRGFAFHVANVGVAYREDITQVKELMMEAFYQVRASEAGRDIIGPMEMHGVVELGDSAVVVRSRIKTKPGSQWAIGRAYNEYLKSVFDEHGIEIPYPHMTLYWGEDKLGNAPPLRVQTTKVHNHMTQAAETGSPANTKPVIVGIPESSDDGQPG